MNGNKSSIRNPSSGNLKTPEIDSKICFPKNICVSLKQFKTIYAFVPKLVLENNSDRIFLELFDSNLDECDHKKYVMSLCTSLKAASTIPPNSEAWFDKLQQLAEVYLHL